MKSDGGRGLSFPHALTPEDPTSTRGGCEYGGSRCEEPVELEVVVPGLLAGRRTCRDHAGWWMHAVASERHRGSLMVVRRVAS